MQASAQTNWDFAVLAGLNHPVTKLQQRFADAVKERTAGQLVITIRPSGELPFRATEMLKAVGEGQVQLGEAYSGFIAGSVPIAAVAQLPYLVRTFDQLGKVQPTINKYVDPKFDEFGVKRLLSFSWPVLNVFGRGEPIRAPEDFAGRKIRTADPFEAHLLTSLGASVVSLTAAEVPMALERGVANGFVTTAFNLVGANWQTFTDWAWISNIHIGGPDYTVVNKEAYEALPPDVRAGLDEVSAGFGQEMSAENLATEGKSLERLKSEFGVTIVETSAEEQDRLASEMTPYWDEWAKQHGADAEALLKEMRAALNQ